MEDWGAMVFNLIGDDDLAKKIARECDDDECDGYWCGRCGHRIDAIEEYRVALLKEVDKRSEKMRQCGN